MGAEAALKADVSERRPELRAAFGRPGLVTFKDPSGAAGEAIGRPSPLARAWGAALGPAADPRAAAARIAAAVGAEEPVRLQVWERDRWRPGDEPEGFAYGELAAAARAGIVEAWPKGHVLLDGEEAAAGERVVDVVVAPEEPLFVGVHRHGEGRPPGPGGRIAAAMPAEAPSRAYRKLEEALVWSGAPVRAGDVAVELGSSPGGASYALLRRGLEVHGIDPGAMDPVVLNFAGPGGGRFHHHHRPMAQVDRADLPRDLHWVLCDVNLAPQVALRTVARLAGRPRPALLGVLVTLKLDTWKALRHLPTWERTLAAMGMAEVRVTQLPSNRLELFACGLTAAGVRRREAG